MLYMLRKGSKPLLTDKLQEEKGLTLVEMLCATLILVLLSLLVGSGLNMAADSYRDMVLQSEMKLLLSTLSNALADELRYADDVSSNEAVGGVLTSYQSELYGKGTKLRVVNNDVSSNSGQIYVEVPSDSPGAGPDSYFILPDGAYGGGAWLYGVPTGGFGITYHTEKRLFDVELTVREMKMKGSNRVFADSGIEVKTAFTVRCLN